MRISPVSIGLVALLGPVVGLHAAEGETFTGTAASGAHERPRLLVDGKRYELKASDKADASVAETLVKFSKGDADTYTVKGKRGTRLSRRAGGEDVARGSPSGPTLSSPSWRSAPAAPPRPRRGSPSRPRRRRG
jgi:hypothetical protein